MLDKLAEHLFSDHLRRRFLPVSPHFQRESGRSVGSVWTNYSGLPTEPGDEEQIKNEVQTVQVVQSLRSVQIVENHRVRFRRSTKGTCSSDSRRFKRFKWSPEFDGDIRAFAAPAVIRPVLVAVTTPARLCSQTFTDSTVELNSSLHFEGESHGRLISVVSE
jgi:hypothetical protein